MKFFGSLYFWDNNFGLLVFGMTCGSPVCFSFLGHASQFLTCFCHLQNISDIRNCRRTKVPVFDLETGARSGFKELEVSEECGVV